MYNLLFGNKDLIPGSWLTTEVPKSATFQFASSSRTNLMINSIDLEKHMFYQFVWNLVNQQDIAPLIGLLALFQQMN